MKIYKECMDSVKAPEDLIRRTRMKMEEAAAKENTAAPLESSNNTDSAFRDSSRKTRSFFFVFRAAAAVAALILIIVLPKQQAVPTLKWQIASVTTEKAFPGIAAPSLQQTEISTAPTLSAAELRKLFPGFELSEEEHTGNTSTYYLRKGTAFARYLISDDPSAIPQELSVLEPQICGNTEFRLALSVDGAFRYVVWEADGHFHFITFCNYSKDELSSFFKIFL